MKHKHKGLIQVWTRMAPVALFSGVLQAQRVYVMAHEKKSFLLPLQYVYKQTAWCLGLLRGHLDEYDPDSRQYATTND